MQTHVSILRPPCLAVLLAGSIAALTTSAQTSSASNAADTSTKDEVVKLSPFTVDASADKGYFAPNTLAGSRMKTNLADLGAAISVVTKKEMEDFGSIDANDVFRYEINTEGSGYYTPATQAFRNDGILDVNAGGTQGNNVASLTNATANRVRGIGIPSSAVNYYPSIAAIPPDVYNTQSIEISRGPNSMLFGLGSPAGIVNQSTTQADLNRDWNQVTLRTDDRGSFRSSFNFNRKLIGGKAAIYGAYVYDNEQFQRKPSYDKTRREYLAATFKPFSKTTIRANFESYDNNNRRPNTISPIDYITQWNLAGRPIYDALTKKITLSSGQVIGPYISSASSPYAQQVRDYIRSLPNYNPALRGTSATAFNGTDTNFSFYNGQPIFSTTRGQLIPTLSLAVPNPSASVLYVPGVAAMPNRTTMQISNGELQNWYQPLFNNTYTTGYAIPAGKVNKGTAAPPNVNSPISNIWNNPASADAYDRDNFMSTGWTNNSFITNLGNYRYAGVTDRSIYDWKKLNILQADYGHQENKNYEVDIDQDLTHDLYFNAGWFRQQFHQVTNYTIGQLNAVAVRIDENKYLPNGKPNPNVGLPFVTDQDPDRYIIDENDDHFRGMLAWSPDFTMKHNWLRWLGHHQILGLWSRDEGMNFADRQRLSYVAAGSPAAAYRYMSNPTNDADGNRTGWHFTAGNGATLTRDFYLAHPGDPMGKVTAASGEWNAGDQFNSNIVAYNYGTNSFENENVTTQFVAGVTDPARSQRALQSYSAGASDYWWNDRLVTTFGARLDKFKARNATSAAITMPNGTVLPALTAPQKFYDTGYFNYSSIWNRFTPWQYTTGRTKTGGFVFTPFRHWDAIDSRAHDNQFWQVVRDFGFVYNWSDNFDVPTGVQNDAFGKQLPNPQGVGRDFGIQFSAFDNKLFARVTWFRSTSQNFRISAGTAINRLTAQVPQSAPDSSAASVDAMFKSWARAIAKINLGIDPTIENPPALSPTQEAAVQAGAEKIWQLPYSYYENLPGAITATGDAVATGMEAQVNYNTGNWRNRLTFGKQITRNSNVLKQYDEWYAKRSPVWAAAKASDYLLPQYQNLKTYSVGTTQVDLTNFLTSYGYNSSIRITNADGGRSPQNWIDVNLTPQVQLSKDLDGQEAPGQRKYRWAYNTGYDFTTGRLRGWGLGAAERWESSSIIGYYGKSSHGNATNPNLIDISDVTKPIYDKANWYTDLFVNYKRKVFNNRVDLIVQLNVENVFENGHLQVVAVNYDASPYGYRIIDSRKFTLTTTFNF